MQLPDDTVTVNFDLGDHKILFVFNEADKESSVFYINIAEYKFCSFILDYDESAGTVVGTTNGNEYTFIIGEAGNLLPQKTTIQLTATPAEGYIFIGWRIGEK